MPGLSILNSFESKAEKPKFAGRQIGGPMGFPDEWGEALAESGRRAVSDVAESVADLFNQVVKVEQKKDDQKTQIGGKTELQFDKPNGVDKDKLRQIEYHKRLSQEQKQLIEDEVRKKALAKQREDVIKTVGGISNVSYEDVMDENGQLRVDIEAYFNRKNSEMAEAEIKKQKQNQVSQATKPFMGEGELLKGGENQSHFTKAVG